MPRSLQLTILGGIFLLTTGLGCTPTQPAAATPTRQPATQTPAPPTRTPTPTPQPTLAPATFGPNQEDFPPDVNPLTGLPVANPHLLQQPALLVSINHFPSEVRPQGGLSFAPWVFEYLIATGTTRFAAVFHGGIPYPEVPRTGDCEVRNQPFVGANTLLGNRVWLDQNADGIHSPEEPGVGGICVDLYDEDGTLVQQTSTDSNGFYGFDVSPGTYSIEFVIPDGWEFTEPDVGFENSDSDAGQVSGRTEPIQVEADDRFWDAGLLPLSETDPSDLPPAEVGPVRSARLIHIHLQNFLQDSCLIYAGSTRQIRGQIPGCATVFKKGDGGLGSMLPISRMLDISEENSRKQGSKFNYANNRFAEEAPAGGTPARQVDLFFAQLNQSRWVYDPVYQGWLRYVDNVSEQTEFHVDTDRLTGRQIYFENLVVLFVEHEVLAPLIIDMYLQPGQQEDGLAFRDGRMYEIEWSTRAGEYEQETGFRRPLALLDQEGQPFPLRPGRTWFIVATPYSRHTEIESGVWKFRIYAPPGAGLY